MNGLKDLQESFQRAVVDGDDAVLADLVDSPKEKRDVLLGVYRHAYGARLVDILQSDYEKLHAFLGDDQFDDLARGHIKANPSTTPNARWYGAKLPEFLTANAPWRDQPALHDLAALERALNDVFDADEANSLALDELGHVAPDAWPALTFTPHPATRRVDLTTNAADIWRALNDDKTPPAPRSLGETAQFIVARNDTMATFRPAASDEAMMWDEMAKGATFSVLCEMLAIFGGEEAAAARAAGYLKGWIEAGMLVKDDAGAD